MKINAIECNHLEYNEIKKYLEVTDETFFNNDLSLYKDIENRLRSCRVCEKRLQAYILMEEPKPKKEKEPVPIRVLKDLVRKLNIQFETLQIVLNQPALALKGGNEEKKDISIEGGGLGDIDVAITNDGGFWFRLEQPDVLLFKLNKDIRGVHEYEVILLRADDDESDEKEFRLTLNKNKSAELNGGNELLPLLEGGYSGIVIKK